MPVSNRSLADMLGFPADARLLILNADDFGMSYAGNVATIEGLLERVYSCATAMVPCPWFAHVVAFAREHPHADIGVHLTHTSEWAWCRWGSVAARETVPSLIDADGYFFATLEAVYAHASCEDAEREARAQIDRAMECGIDVTHLDSHMGVMQIDPRYVRCYVEIASDYRLPIRMAPRSWLCQNGMADVVEEIDRRGILIPDHFNYGGPRTLESTAAYWTKVLRELRPGVTEIYVHPAVPSPELEPMGRHAAQRPADHAFFTKAETRKLIESLGIVLIGYRAIRELQRNGR